MKLTACIKKLRPVNPFRIARDEKTFVDNVFIRVDDEGVVGYGEASPNKFYHETASDVLEKLSAIKSFLSDKKISSVTDIHTLWQEIWPLVQPSRAAQCGVDIALWDLLGKKEQSSVSRLLWNCAPKQLISSCTLGICEPPEWESRVSAVSECPVLKVKMDEKGDVRFLQFIRSQTNAKIRVDANCSWLSLDVPNLISTLKTLNVEFVEQPLPPENNNDMELILKKAELPILADESCTIADDIPLLKGKFSGINIKLVKCGGITPAIEMIHVAHNIGLSVMIGCMLESNLLIAAGVAAAQKAEYVDLDGSWLLRDNVFDGIEFLNGIIAANDKAGLGVCLCAGQEI